MILNVSQYVAVVMLLLENVKFVPSGFLNRSVILSIVFLGLKYVSIVFAKSV